MHVRVATVVALADLECRTDKIENRDTIVRFELRNAAAHSFDNTREVHAQDWLRPEKPPNEAAEDGRMRRKHAAIGPSHCGRMHRDQHLARVRNGLRHLPDFKDIWPAIAWADNRFHGGPLST